MDIRIATSDQDILGCYPVIRELRPHIDDKSFVAKIRSQIKSGYMLAYVKDSNNVVAVAGFRFGESLSWGQFMYVDDLVTISGNRSQGYGTALLKWLAAYAEKKGCRELHLDSGVQRKDAHRFYEREKMEVIGYHFRKFLKPKKTSK